jgi:hypothetical protein
VPYLHAVPDDEELQTQGTDAARDDYRAAVQAAVTALREHAERVLDGEAGPPGGEADRARLRAALTLVAEAESHLTGSAPFLVDLDDGDEFEGINGFDAGFGGEAEFDDEDHRGASGFVIVEHSLQLAVLDEPGLVAAAREAYRASWPGAVEADAEIAVAGVSAAVGELLHAQGWDALMAGSDYLEPRSGEVSIMEVEDLP